MADTQEFLEDGVMSLVLQFTDKLPLKATEIGYEVIAEQQQMLVRAILQHFQQEQETGEPRECLCQLCNREYPVWFAPNDLWNRVMRVDGKEEHPFVCPICFAFKYEKEIDPKTVWMLAPQKGLVYSQSEVDRLIREAKKEELEWSRKTSVDSVDYSDFLIAVDNRVKELSKQKEGSREA